MWAIILPLCVTDIRLREKRVEIWELIVSFSNTVSQGRYCLARANYCLVPANYCLVPANHRLIPANYRLAPPNNERNR